MKAVETSENQHKRRRAIVRLVLGQLQIVGATMGVYFLITTGVTALTIWTVASTGVISVFSRFLFKIVWPERN